MLHTENIPHGWNFLVQLPPNNVLLFLSYEMSKLLKHPNGFKTVRRRCRRVRFNTCASKTKKELPRIGNCIELTTNLSSYNCLANNCFSFKLKLSPTWTIFITKYTWQRYENRLPDNIQPIYVFQPKLHNFDMILNI